MTRPCSVIIPTRDRPVLLVRAVESALAELPTDGEVIVVDDASNPPASKSLSQLIGPQLTVLLNPSPLGGGGSPSRNKGAQAAVGRVLFFLDDDDAFEPGYCQRVLDSGATEQAEFGFAARKFVTNHANKEPVFSLENRELPAGLLYSKEPFAKRTFPFSAGFWITRAGYETAGPMAETLSTNSDTEYCCRMYYNGLKGWYSPEPGVVITDHCSSGQRRLGHVTHRTKAADRAAAMRYIALTHQAYLAADPGAALFVHKRWMKHAVRAGQIAEAKASIAQAPQSALRTRLKFQFAVRRLIEFLHPPKHG